VDCNIPLFSPEWPDKSLKCHFTVLWHVPDNEDHQRPVNRGILTQTEGQRDTARGCRRPDCLRIDLWCPIIMLGNTVDFSSVAAVRCMDAAVPSASSETFFLSFY
jgi:hypothetical protein